jgi:hypothetical protein
VNFGDSGVLVRKDFSIMKDPEFITEDIFEYTGTTPAPGRGE